MMETLMRVLWALAIGVICGAGISICGIIIYEGIKRRLS